MTEGTNPRIIRVLLRYHEAVSEAARAAYLELHALGVPEPLQLLLGRGIRAGHAGDKSQLIDLR